VVVGGDHQINDDWSVYFTATSTKVETFGRYAPVPGVVIVDDGTPNDINNGVICAYDPDCAANADGLPTYYFHRFAAAGNRDNFTDTQNSDYLVGFQGQLPTRSASTSARAGPTTSTSSWAAATSSVRWRLLPPTTATTCSTTRSVPTRPSSPVCRPRSTVSRAGRRTSSTAR